MNERLEQILFLVRYSTKVEITVPYLVDLSKGATYADNDEKRASLNSQAKEAIDYLMNDDVNIETIPDNEKDETKIIIEVK